MALGCISLIKIARLIVRPGGVQFQKQQNKVPVAMNEANMKTLTRIRDIIRDGFDVDAIYLYGSRAKAKERTDSDWDVAVLFSRFEQDPVKRLLRPQQVEAVLERELRMYGQISVVDVESVPPVLQMNIIMGWRIYDRLVPHVRRVEYSIISRIEKDFEYA